MPSWDVIWPVGAGGRGRGREKISFTRLIRAAHVSASLRRNRESPSKKITRPLMERTRRWVMASCNNNNIRVSGSLSTPTRAKKNPRNGIFLFYDCARSRVKFDIGRRVGHPFPSLLCGWFAESLNWQRQKKNETNQNNFPTIWAYRSPISFVEKIDPNHFKRRTYRKDYRWHHSVGSNLTAVGTNNQPPFHEKRKKKIDSQVRSSRVYFGSDKKWRKKKHIVERVE